MKTNYKHRVILLSDMHYTTEETANELKLIYPDAKASAAAGDALGHTQKEKIQCITNDVNEFMKKKSVDAVLVLGDLSIDDYCHRNLPENYCQKLKEECMDRLACPSYAIPGNHDSYPDDIWKNIFGYDRQYSIKIQNAAFIMLDTFHSTPADSPSGSPYTGVDLDFLKEELKKYPKEQIFLCAHYVNEDEYLGELSALLRQNERIVCLFDAHTHINTLHLPDEHRKQYQINIGGYGYNGEAQDGKWIFNRFDSAWAWGYEVLEWNESEAHVYHVKPARRYIGSAGAIDYPGALEDELTIKLKAGAQF